MSEYFDKIVTEEEKEFFRYLAFKLNAKTLKVFNGEAPHINPEDRLKNALIMRISVATTKGDWAITQPFNRNMITGEGAESQLTAIERYLSSRLKADIEQLLESNSLPQNAIYLEG